MCLLNGEFEKKNQFNKKTIRGKKNNKKNNDQIEKNNMKNKDQMMKLKTNQHFIKDPRTKIINKKIRNKIQVSLNWRTTLKFCMINVDLKVR